MFIHYDDAVFAIIYVDDFKLAGPAKKLDKHWKMIRKRIVMGDPCPVDQFLGCTHRESSLNGGQIRSMKYDMTNFIKQCIELYDKIVCNLLKRMPTQVVLKNPNIPEDLDRMDKEETLHHYMVKCPHCSFRFNSKDGMP